MVGFHRLLESPHGGFNVVDLFEGCKGCRVHRLLGTKINVLIEQAEVQAICLEDVAGIWRLLTRNQSEHSCLPGSVTADEPDLFSRIDLERYAAKDLCSSV